MNVYLDGEIGYVKDGGGIAVSFTRPAYAAARTGGSNEGLSKSSSTLLKKLTTALEVAPWGEDNQFPQNIVKELDASGVAKRAIAFRSAALFGRGIGVGIVTGVDPKTGDEIIDPVNIYDYPEISDFMEENDYLVRFYTEFMPDLTAFRNCFPEGILSKDGKKIKRWVHQESCDCRFKQMNDNMEINTVYLSKLWGGVSDQFVKYKKTITTSGTSTQKLTEVDGKYIKQLPALDMYDPVGSLHILSGKGKRNFILPVNMPSFNKTYYQLAEWDGARYSGWLQIAAKIPAMLMALYENAFNLLWHIEIPESYFSKKLGDEVWESMNQNERDQERLKVLQQMSRYLSGEENAYKALVTYFDIDRQTKQELGHVKITALERKVNVEKELLTSAVANSETLFAFGVDPTLMGASMPGGGLYSGGAGSGSDKREAWLIFDNLLFTERQIALEPLRLTQRYNGWDPKLRFFFRSIVLTTLDKNTGTEKKIS